MQASRERTPPHILDHIFSRYRGLLHESHKRFSSGDVRVILRLDVNAVEQLEYCSGEHGVQRVLVISRIREELPDEHARTLRLDARVLANDTGVHLLVQNAPLVAPAFPVARERHLPVGVHPAQRFSKRQRCNGGGRLTT